MRVLALRIENFRGIRNARLVLPEQVALVGPTASGKSTIVDALSLVFGRQKLVRELTEHDFSGSSPRREDRIRIVATLGGFSTNDPADHPHWFSEGRAIEQWWNPDTSTAEPAPSGAKSLLCADLAYSARFDQDELVVEQRRYFHDDDELRDPFMDEPIAWVPPRLLSEVGFFVLPARRTWPSTISFGSELFRKAVATAGGVPASAVLAYRDLLRSPDSPLEQDAAIRPLVEHIDARMAQLLPGRPRLQLRVTSTDSESLLQALVPHYTFENDSTLPAARHGTGLLALQTLVLLLEIGRARREKGESFILALEEPELHVPPGLQRRLIGEAAAVSNQVVCTTHAPRVAAFFEASCIQMLTRVVVPAGQAGGTPTERLEGRPLAPDSMMTAPNALVQLYTDHRIRVVEALMFPTVLVPEGRIDFDWLRLLLDVSEMGSRSPAQGAPTAANSPPFGSIVGVIPTRDAAIKVTFESLRTLHGSVFALVDGDADGDRYIGDLLSSSSPPRAIVQWPPGWEVEDVVAWCLAPGPGALLEDIGNRLEQRFASLSDLTTALKNADGRAGGLKAHYLAHEEIVAAMKQHASCVIRADLVLQSLTRAALGEHLGFAHLAHDARSTGDTTISRFQP